MKRDPKKNKTNLVASEAIEKLKELIKKEVICLFCSQLNEMPITTRPMSTLQVDNEGSIWFMSSLKSKKNDQIERNKTVQLFYSNPASSEYLSVFGNAIIVTDRKKIEELWTPIANAWFKNGKDDPDVSLIKVAPETAYYWDTKSSKMISMIKMIVATVTGNAPDDGVEGALDVK